MPIAGSEHVLPLDTLIVAVGEKPEIQCIRSATSDGFDVKTTDWGSIAADPRTLATSRKGFATTDFHHGLLVPGRAGTGILRQPDAHLGAADTEPTRPAIAHQSPP